MTLDRWLDKKGRSKDWAGLKAWWDALTEEDKRQLDGQLEVVEKPPSLLIKHSWFPGKECRSKITELDAYFDKYAPPSRLACPTCGEMLLGKRAAHPCRIHLGGENHCFCYVCGHPRAPGATARAVVTGGPLAGDRSVPIVVNPDFSPRLQAHLACTGLRVVPRALVRIGCGFETATMNKRDVVAINLPRHPSDTLRCGIVTDSRKGEDLRRVLCDLEKVIAAKAAIGGAYVWQKWEMLGPLEEERSDVVPVEIGLEAHVGDSWVALGEDAVLHLNIGKATQIRRGQTIDNALRLGAWRLSLEGDKAEPATLREFLVDGEVVEGGRRIASCTGDNSGLRLRFEEDLTGLHPTSFRLKLTEKVSQLEWELRTKVTVHVQTVESLELFLKKRGGNQWIPLQVLAAWETDGSADHCERVAIRNTGDSEHHMYSVDLEIDGIEVAVILSSQRCLERHEQHEFDLRWEDIARCLGYGKKAQATLRVRSNAATVYPLTFAVRTVSQREISARLVTTVEASPPSAGYLGPEARRVRWPTPLFVNSTNRRGDLVVKLEVDESTVSEVDESEAQQDKSTVPPFWVRTGSCPLLQGRVVKSGSSIPNAVTAQLGVALPLRKIIDDAKGKRKITIAWELEDRLGAIPGTVSTDLEVVTTDCPDILVGPEVLSLPLREVPDFGRRMDLVHAQLHGGYASFFPLSVQVLNQTTIAALHSGGLRGATEVRVLRCEFENLASRPVFDRDLRDIFGLVPIENETLAPSKHDTKTNLTLLVRPDAKQQSGNIELYFELQDAAPPPSVALRWTMLEEPGRHPIVFDYGTSASAFGLMRPNGDYVQLDWQKDQLASSHGDAATLLFPSEVYLAVAQEDERNNLCSGSIPVFGDAAVKLGEADPNALIKSAKPLQVIGNVWTGSSRYPSADRSSDCGDVLEMINHRTTSRSNDGITLSLSAVVGLQLEHVLERAAQIHHLVLGEVLMTLPIAYAPFQVKAVMERASQAASRVKHSEIIARLGGGDKPESLDRMARALVSTGTPDGDYNTRLSAFARAYEELTGSASEDSIIDFENWRCTLNAVTDEETAVLLYYLDSVWRDECPPGGEKAFTRCVWVEDVGGGTRGSVVAKCEYTPYAKGEQGAFAIKRMGVATSLLAGDFATAIVCDLIEDALLAEAGLVSRSGTAATQPQASASASIGHAFERARGGGVPSAPDKREVSTWADIRAYEAERRTLRRRISRKSYGTIWWLAERAKTEFCRRPLEASEVKFFKDTNLSDENLRGIQFDNGSTVVDAVLKAKSLEETDDTRAKVATSLRELSIRVEDYSARVKLGYKENFRRTLRSLVMSDNGLDEESLKPETLGSALPGLEVILAGRGGACDPFYMQALQEFLGTSTPIRTANEFAPELGSDASKTVVSAGVGRCEHRRHRHHYEASGLDAGWGLAKWGLYVGRERRCIIAPLSSSAETEKAHLVKRTSVTPGGKDYTPTVVFDCPIFADAADAAARATLQVAPVQWNVVTAKLQKSQVSCTRDVTLAWYVQYQDCDASLYQWVDAVVVDEQELPQPINVVPRQTVGGFPKNMLSEFGSAHYYRWMSVE